MKTDISPVSVDVYFIPVATRVPLKFGTQVVTHVTCVRVCVTVANKEGQKAQGWGETPLSAEWAWPSSSLGHNERNEVMEDFCRMLAQAWVEFDRHGHPMELGHGFIESILPGLLEQLNGKWTEKVGPMPHLAALVCSSAFDVAMQNIDGMVAPDSPVNYRLNEALGELALAARAMQQLAKALNPPKGYPRCEGWRLLPNVENPSALISNSTP